MRRPASSTQVVETGLSDFESDDQVTMLEKGSSGEEDDGPREPVRKGTLSKDIETPMAGYSMKTLMARINFVAIMFAVQVPVVVFIATMTDLLHPLSGFVAAGSFVLSIFIWAYKALKSSSQKEKDQKDSGIVMVSFGLYITAPCCITSSLLYYFSATTATLQA